MIRVQEGVSFEIIKPKGEALYLDLTSGSQVELTTGAFDRSSFSSGGSFPLTRTDAIDLIEALVSHFGIVENVWIVFEEPGVDERVVGVFKKSTSAGEAVWASRYKCRTELHLVS